MRLGMAGFDGKAWSSPGQNREGLMSQLPDSVSSTPGRPLKVGLFLPNWSGSMNGRPPRWGDIAALAKHTEEIGFDSLWVADTILVLPEKAEPMGYWECWSLLAALASVTSRVELGSLVTGGSFRNPVLLAHLVNTVEEISGGRVILGIGAGEVGQYGYLGMHADGRYGRLEEALSITRALLREGHADFMGQHYQVRDAELPLRGPRANGPPIMLGTYPAPGPRMRRLAARYADGWNGWLAFDNSSPEAVQPARASLDAACRAIGRDPETLWRSVAVGVALKGRRLTFGPWDIGAGALTGSPEELAETLRQFARQGISHLQVYLGHNTIDDLDTFAPVLALLDAGSLGSSVQR
jgi:alkanesulfonate monooxygenase SsuD/methylene tetrahydromethanopterin reductase-like flavin-dependent oxidoreductase (luciferase family)